MIQRPPERAMPDVKLPIQLRISKRPADVKQLPRGSFIMPE
jgi:hypothetical protein